MQIGKSQKGAYRGGRVGEIQLTSPFLQSPGLRTVTCVGGFCDFLSQQLFLGENHVRCSMFYEIFVNILNCNSSVSSSQSSVSSSSSAHS